MTEFPKTVAQFEAEASGAKLPSGMPVSAKKRSLEKKEEELRRRIMERLETTTKKGILVIEEWLEQPDHHPHLSEKRAFERSLKEFGK